MSHSSERKRENFLFFVEVLLAPSGGRVFETRIMTHSSSFPSSEVSFLLVSFSSPISLVVYNLVLV